MRQLHQGDHQLWKSHSHESQWMDYDQNQLDIMLFLYKNSQIYRKSTYLNNNNCFLLCKLQ